MCTIEAQSLIFMYPLLCLFFLRLYGFRVHLQSYMETLTLMQPHEREFCLFNVTGTEH